MSTKRLAAQRARVSARHTVGNNTQRDNDGADFAETLERIVAGDDERPGADFVSLCP